MGYYRLILVSSLVLIILASSGLRAQIVWSEHLITSGFDGASDVCTADLDGDGDIDVLGAADPDNEITWWENDGNQNFLEHIIDTNFYGAKCLLPVDLDQDGDLDILAAAGTANEVAWWENDGNECFIKHPISSTFTEARWVDAADVDGDGEIDVLGTALYLDQVAWWENEGGENFERHPITTTFDGAFSVYACDINGDGETDVLSAAVFDGEVAWWENEGAESFVRHTLTDQFAGSHFAIPSDLDSDGDSDIIATAAYDNKIAWWENDGSENFPMHLIAENIPGSIGVFATDIDGDLDVDIVSSARLSNQIFWWENDGNQNFIPQVIADDIYSPGAVYTDDLDQDGDMDVLAVACGGDQILWWEQGGLPTNLEINLTPLGAPIIIPPQGGSFAFEASATNNSTEPQSTSVWCSILVPGGFQFLAVGPVDYTFNPGTTHPRTLFQFVPENAPAGGYTYYGFLGTYPWSIVAADSFSFSKQGTNTQWFGSADWKLYGDFFGVNEYHPDLGSAQADVIRNFPNPFNPTTTFRFTLPAAAQVTLEVFDVKGRVVGARHAVPLPAGEQNITFDGSNLPSGVYLYRLIAGGNAANGKMVLLK